MSKIRDIEPVLQYAILCDAVAKDSFGKPVYIGVFDNLSRPTVLPQFVVAIKWVCGTGSHVFKFKILDPNLNTLQVIGDFQMQLQSKIHSFQQHIPIINFGFNKPGIYWIEIILNESSYLSIPLPVHQLQV